MERAVDDARRVRRRERLDDDSFRSSRRSAAAACRRPACSCARADEIKSCTVTYLPTPRVTSPRRGHPPRPQPSARSRGSTDHRLRAPILGQRGAKAPSASIFGIDDQAAKISLPAYCARWIAPHIVTARRSLSTTLAMICASAAWPPTRRIIATRRRSLTRSRTGSATGSTARRTGRTPPRSRETVRMAARCHRVSAVRFVPTRRHRVYARE